MGPIWLAHAVGFAGHMTSRFYRPATWMGSGAMIPSGR